MEVLLLPVRGSPSCCHWKVVIGPTEEVVGTISSHISPPVSPATRPSTLTHASTEIKRAKLAMDKTFRFTETQDWFSGNIPTWRTFFAHIKSKAPRVLEIGSWEGRSAVFLSQELCGKDGEIVCIDHFDLFQREEGRERYNKVVHNLSQVGGHYRIIDEFSVPGLYKVLGEETTRSDPGFDWIYIDGSHEADDTFLDGELAWRLARKGAIMIFDDYLWDKEPVESRHHPRRGIDGFLALHDGEYVKHYGDSQYQMIIEKTSDMRIGFLTKQNAHKEQAVAAALDYGIHIAITVDSTYAAPASVVLQTTCEHTSGRITFYVIDCGLTGIDKEKLTQTIPSDGRVDATVRFLQPPLGSLTATFGPVWAKIDMITLLPVERVLYLDADILVRKDLRPLWETTLEGRSLAAAADVGFPGGPKSNYASYFNAGVLLMNLTKLREKMDGMVQMAKSMADSDFKDQDALNEVLTNDWKSLSLSWNAQGLGTYATNDTADRVKLLLNEMEDPDIVHFTGPLHPSLDRVVNPWVQPYTAKPWGYAGAPGHPYAESWWQALEQTPWSGWRAGEEWEGMCRKQESEAITAGLRDFQEKLRLSRGETKKA